MLLPTAPSNQLVIPTSRGAEQVSSAAVVLHGKSTELRREVASFLTQLREAG